MPNLAIVNSSRKGIMVHKAGCRDLARLNPVFETVWTEEHDSVQSVVESVYGDMMPEDDQPWTWYEGEFRFFPCCPDLPRESEPATVESEPATDNSFRARVLRALTEQGIGHDPLANTDDLHTLLTKLGICDHCGQGTPPAPPYAYGPNAAKDAEEAWVETYAGRYGVSEDAARAEYRRGLFDAIPAPTVKSVTLTREALSDLLVGAALVGMGAPRDICTTRGEMQRWIRNYPSMSGYVIDPNE